MAVRTFIGLGLLALAAVPAAAQDADYAYAQSGYPTAGYDTDGQSVDSIAVFFEPLSRYGRWLDSRYGRVWQPNVARDWRPYTIGHWEEGAYGQTWRSDEPFGWAVFHFGRWAYDPSLGWVWSPDTVWGPGWVAWRDSDEITGWAPLPPQIDLFAGGALSGGGFNDWGYDQWYQPGWVYVPRGYLYSRSLRGVYFPLARNRDFWGRTHGVTRYDRVDGAVVNRSFGFRGFGDNRRGGDLGDGRRAGGPRRDDGGRPDLRLNQTSPRGGNTPAPSSATPREGFGAQGLPPRNFGGRDGFVPGTPQPRPFDRRGASPPPAGTARPAPSFVPPPQAGAMRPAPTFVPPPQARPMPAPRPAPPPVRTREPNANERPR